MKGTTNVFSICFLEESHAVQLVVILGTKKRETGVKGLYLRAENTDDSLEVNEKERCQKREKVEVK